MSESKPIITVAGVSLEFNPILFRGLPMRYVPRCQNRAGLKVNVYEVNNLPSVFLREKSLGGNIWCTKKGNFEYYYFMNKGGDMGPVAFSYDIDKKMYVLYIFKKYRFSPPFPPRFSLHPLFNGLYDIAFYSMVLSHHQGFLMHAAGFYKNEENGILVCGHSGDGKSTLSLQLRRAGYKIISDDCVALRRSSLGFCIYPYPIPWRWAGMAGNCSQGVRLSHIYFLTKERNKHTQFKTISKKEFFLKWQEYIQFYPFFKEKVALLTDLCLDIAGQAERFVLSYVLKDGINHNGITIAPYQ